MLFRGRHYQTGELLEIVCESHRISSLNRLDEPVREDDPFLAPAYFDLQINGAYGVNFSSPGLTEEDVHQATRACQQRGIAAFCPTVITTPLEVQLHALKILAGVRRSSTQAAAALPCFHLEGPYICAQDGPRGAHPIAHTRLPDWDEFQRLQTAAEGAIRLVTLAPELPGALEFIEKLVQAQVVVALGHSAATPAQIDSAVQAGATLSTHLGNGCARLLPRHDNVLWAQLAQDQLFASVIADGHHLPWHVIQCIQRCKSWSRLIITCDASPLAGLAPGVYHPWGQPVEVLTNGKIVLTDQGVLAGSWAFTPTCVELACRQLQAPYPLVHSLASDNPRRLLGLTVPHLAVGQPADFIAVKIQDGFDIQHTHVIRHGLAQAYPETMKPIASGER